MNLRPGWDARGGQEGAGPRIHQVVKAPSGRCPAEGSLFRPLLHAARGAAEAPDQRPRKRQSHGQEGHWRPIERGSVGAYAPAKPRASDNIFVVRVVFDRIKLTKSCSLDEALGAACIHFPALIRSMPHNGGVRRRCAFCR